MKRLNKFFYFAILCCGSATAADTLPKLGVDKSQVTVSGLSSGGYMAVQLHVAYSSTFKGVGVVAGGPYNCAENSFFSTLGKCMSKPTSIDVPKLVAITKKWAESKDIDPVDNLKSSKVYLYSGTLDSTVNSGVVLALRNYYDAFTSSPNIKYKNDIASEHSMVTAQYGNACNSKSAPYISNCNFDLAGAILSHLYDNLKQPNAASGVAESLTEFDQSEFVSGNGMAKTGWAYIPSACRTSASMCKVHVALHGCQQSSKDVGLEFVKNAGYNRWAQANNIVVLYPQTGTGATNSCWDWWGYGSADYAKKTGPQMVAIKSMINKVTTGAK